MSRNRLIIGKEMGQVGKTRNQYIGNVANVNLYTGFFHSDLLKVSQKHFPKANFPNWIIQDLRLVGDYINTMMTNFHW